MASSAIERLFGLSGKVAVVTGGASGIGLSTVALLAGAGAKVAVVDRNAEAAEQALAKAGIGPGGNGIALAADVAEEAAVERATDAVIQEFGRIDILVNCAGIAIRRPAIEVSLADWEKVLAVNMTGSFLFSRAVARHMIAAKKGGAIVQTASIMGLSGGGLYPNISYQTSKGAVVNMTRALAVEWAPHQIRVNAVAPTWVKTPFIAGLMEQPELIKRIEAITPLARLAEPEDVAAAILYLASPGAGMVTGHTLFVDGGFLAQ